MVDRLLDYAGEVLLFAFAGSLVLLIPFWTWAMVRLFTGALEKSANIEQKEETK